ncbi:MAG: DUF4340 domain-containing protein [Candidatus Hydrogenedentes bacterium]|nr:DUF4340 domain-containing protein [Candidatus Hydrogenedentota bacterium]
MSPKATAAMFLVLALILAAYALTSFLEKSAVEELIQAKRLFEFEPEDIKLLTIDRRDTPTVEATRLGSGDWSVEKPARHIPANIEVWNRAATALAHLLNERTIEEDPQKLSLYELDAPRLRVLAGTTGGEMIQLDVGALDPSVGYAYARVGVGPVILIPLANVLEMDRSLDELRNAHVFPGSRDGETIGHVEYALVFRGLEETDDDGNVTSYRIGDLSTKVILDRSEAGSWRMLEPVEARANQEATENLVKELTFMVGRNYVDRPERYSDYGLDPPNRQITFGAKGRPARALLLGDVAEAEDGGGLFARIEGNPSVFVVDGHILSLLPKRPNAYRELRLFKVNAAVLTDVSVRTKNEAVALRLDDKEGWTVSEPAVEDGDQVAISNYIAFLKQAAGAAFPLEDAGAGFDSPHVSIEMKYLDDPKTYSIVVGALVPGSDPAEFYARMDDGTVTTVPLPISEVLAADSFRFRKKEVFEFPAQDATRLELVFRGTQYILSKVEGRWTVLEPAGHILESQWDATALLEAMSQVRALDIASPRPSDEAMGLDAAPLSATVILDDGATKLGPLRVGKTKAPQSRDRFATVEGRVEVYYLDQSLLDDVAAALEGVVASN